MSKEDELEIEITMLEQELAEKKMKLSGVIETIKVCLRTESDTYDQFRRMYPKLTDRQIKEVYYACDMLTLKYNLKTHKFEIP